MTEKARPIGGKILTAPYKFLLVFVAIAVGVMIWRFLAGLGPTTAMNDGYPWGIWIAFDVVTGTALACGGYAVAILCYILNKGHYHPLVRPAVLTSAVGYTVAGMSIFLDVGRYWKLYGVFMPWRWNLNSVLLEVALCVTAYIVVLWIELAPAMIEEWRDSARKPLRNLARRAAGKLEKGLLFILALGLLLPTMHQSSLGSLVLVAETKLHAFWHTPWLPLLFLLSCLALGYAVVLFESLLASLFFKRKPELPMLRSLAKIMVVVQLAYVAVRAADLGLSGKLAAFQFDREGLLLLTEAALFAAPALLLIRPGPIREARLFVMAVLMVLAGGLYRFDTYLLAYDPGNGWTYFPSIPEFTVTLGFVATEVVVYLAIVKRFPILGGFAPDAPKSGAAPAAPSLAGT